MWPLGRSNSRRQLGPRGEKLARRTLRRRGMKILAGNYRCPAGEIDLIALDPQPVETLVFVEVKTRSDNTYTDPASAVDHDKQRRIRNAARTYLGRLPRPDLYAVRYDVVSIVIPPGRRERPTIEHIPDAF